MRALTLAVLLAATAVLVAVRPAAACDPESDWCSWDAWGVWEEPTYEEPVWIPTWEPLHEPEPLAPAPWDEPPVYVAVWEPPAVAAPVTYEAPAFSPPVYQAPVDEPPVYQPVTYAAPVTDRAPAAVPPSTAWVDPGYVETPVSATPAADRWDEAVRIGAHRVTDTYLSESVTTDGRTTIFRTTTLHQDAETAARAVATVGTGESSGYESVLWNGRNRRSDGSFVRGTVYENFVWNGVAWVHDKYVFFQDDAETAPLAPGPSPLPVQPPLPPAPPSAPSTAATPVPAPVVSTPPGAGTRDPLAPAPPGPAADPYAAAPSPPAGEPAPHDVRAGIALAPGADALARIEVLRGRPVPLWPRALIDGAPGRVASWRLAGGEVTAIGPLSGDGDDPFTATWEQVSAPGSTFAVTLDVEVSLPGEGGRTVSATIAVVVRSPAIVE